MGEATDPALALDRVAFALAVRPSPRPGHLLSKDMGAGV